jgi:hypothetical protein
VYDSVNPKAGDIIAPKTVLGDPVHKDFECIINSKGKKIAFFTMGDYSGLLIEAFEKYDDLNCDILVCACNKKFSRPYQEIQNYQHTIVKKTMPQYDKLNETDKNEILKLLEA